MDAATSRYWKTALIFGFAPFLPHQLVDHRAPSPHSSLLTCSSGIYFHLLPRKLHSRWTSVPPPAHTFPSGVSNHIAVMVQEVGGLIFECADFFLSPFVSNGSVPQIMFFQVDVINKYVYGTKTTYKNFILLLNVD